MAIITAVGFVSCDEEVGTSNFKSSSDSYLQMKLGTTWLYKIDSTRVDLVQPDHRHSFFQKEIISKVDKSRKVIVYTIDLYRTLDTSLSFTKHGTYVLEMYKDRVVHMGNDYNLIILADPVEVGQKWYNLSNKVHNTTSIIDRKLDTYIQNEEVYYDILDVIHYEFLRHDVSKSHRSFYAKDVGLIYEMRFDRLRNTNTTITKSLLHYAY